MIPLVTRGRRASLNKVWARDPRILLVISLGFCEYSLVYALVTIDIRRDIVQCTVWSEVRGRERASKYLLKSKESGTWIAGIRSRVSKFLQL